MNYTKSDEQIIDLYNYAVKKGFSKETFFSRKTLDKYVDTSLDGYRNYPLFLNIFNGKYNERTLKRMMKVDYKSRLYSMVGLSSSPIFESVMMIEPPFSKEIGMSEYVKVATPGDYLLLLNPAMYRQEKYEHFALDKMASFRDDRTWYIYVFATKQECQRQGYGKQLMHLLLSFANEYNYKICLETNLPENVIMYEKFGFKTMNVSVYKDMMDHFVMVYA